MQRPHADTQEDRGKATNLPLLHPSKGRFFFFKKVEEIDEEIREKAKERGRAELKH